MSTLQQLISQKEALERQIEMARKSERADAIAKVHALMAEHGLTLADVGVRGAGKSAKVAAGRGAKVAPKYRDTATGQTWSGRGLQPNWLKSALAAGRRLEDFAV